MEDIIENAVNETNESLEENSSVLTQEEEELLNQVIEEEHSEIPVNSKSLLIDDTTARFSSAPWYEKVKEQEILIAGIGGIGSWVVFLLAKMKPKKMYLYDPDNVDTVNMSGQLYPLSDIGTAKVTAITNTIANYCNYFNYLAYKEYYNENSGCSDIMICGFDNMKARKVFFDEWFKHILLKSTSERCKCLFIDGRLASEEYQIFCIRGDDMYNINEYKTKYLFSDEEAEHTICSYKQTSFMANMIASFIVNLFINFVTNQCNPLIDRDLPFYTTYNAETMYFKTIE